MSIITIYPMKKSTHEQDLTVVHRWADLQRHHTMEDHRAGKAKHRAPTFACRNRVFMGNPGL